MAVRKQIREIISYDARDQIRIDLSLDQKTFGTCFSTITPIALREVRSHIRAIEQPLGPCSGIFTKTMGLPCAHVVSSRREVGLGLTPDDFY
jgi:hypothetical protein